MECSTCWQSAAPTRGRLAALLLFGLVIGACGNEGPTDTEPVEAASLSLDVTDFGVYVGARQTLQVTARDSEGAVVNATVTWSSSNEDVARVSASGGVTGYGHGTAEITATSGTAQASATVTVTGLEESLAGVLNEDFFYTNYVDQDPSPSIQDYACGPKSYDGHLGVDIVLPDFATMDAGIDVLAVAPGTVVATNDGEFDRNKAWSDAEWNVVVIDHDGQLESIYGHLKSGSVAVTVGQTVTAGTKLGEVGSSGRSDMPHLHLELRQQGIVIDPYSGDCSSDREYFRAPLPYQDDFHFIASGVSDLNMTLDLVKDPPPRVDRVEADDPRVTMWVHFHNTGVEPLEFRFTRPDGTLHGTVDLQLDRFYSMSWWWAWWDRSALASWPGIWTVDAVLSGNVVATEQFELTGVVTPPALGRAEGPLSGYGGGEARGDRGPVVRN